MAGARFAVPLLLFAVTGFAHDPGLSYAELRVVQGRLEAHLTFSQRDAGTLTGNALEVFSNGQRVDATNVRTEHDASDTVHLHATYPVPSVETLRVRSALIANLAHGHRQFITVRDAH